MPPIFRRKLRELPFCVGCTRIYLLLVLTLQRMGRRKMVGIRVRDGERKAGFLDRMVDNKTNSRELFKLSEIWHACNFFLTSAGLPKVKTLKMVFNRESFLL